MIGTTEVIETIEKEAEGEKRRRRSSATAPSRSPVHRNNSLIGFNGSNGSPSTDNNNDSSSSSSSSSSSTFLHPDERRESVSDNLAAFLPPPIGLGLARLAVAVHGVVLVMMPVAHNTGPSFEVLN